ncbi:alanine acetyltransferase [Chromobacterium sp. Panama]|uniref:GNAT family N-acetyltransferase n=1 Tax=Chromobacterium sp. Panama TaxID=2161826 RepID=UPI000D323FEB|nr:GNAT family N-acetyltransferase [Chromobacterium sp. Panama]PTU65676.1 alanine acetyltransferase [Chromobacterium sp. Panama]
MLQLERLTLREFRAEDLPNVFYGLSHPEVIKHYGIHYASEEDCRAQMRWFDDIRADGSGLWLALETREDERFLGAVGISSWSEQHHCAELGYWLLPEHWGRGYMREALRGFLRLAYRRFPLNRVYAQVEVDNLGSGKLLRSVGFTLEGVSRECEWKDGRYLSLANYALLRAEHEAEDGGDV